MNKSEWKETKQFTIRAIFGAELHDQEKGVKHTGVLFQTKKKGLKPGGRFPKKGHFISDSKDIETTEAVPCSCEQNLEDCPVCKSNLQ